MPRSSPAESIAMRRREGDADSPIVSHQSHRMLIDELEQTAHKHIIIQSDATLHWEQYEIY